MLNNLRDLYVEELRDLYSAETQLLEALPKMENAAHDEKLKAAFRDHLEETRGHVNRLNQVFQDMNLEPTGKVCHAMKGLIQEGEEAVEELGDPTVKDAALIAAAQRVEHYEIAGYGTVRTFAKCLDEDKAASLLDDTLEEENAADSKLTKLATGGMFASGINKESVHA